MPVRAGTPTNGRDGLSYSAMMLQVRIEQAAEWGSKLRAAKGINLPDTVLPVSALTEKDVADLARW